MRQLSSLDCSAGNISIEANAVAELKLREVQRHIFDAHLMEGGALLLAL
jgi:hypothetical protein